MGALRRGRRCCAAGAPRPHRARAGRVSRFQAVAAKLAHKFRVTSAITLFWRDFQGETSHAEHIGKGVTHALAQIQVEQKIPVIHGVFVFNKVKQAKVRCLGKKHNRGTESAQTALEMARVMRSL